MKRKLTAILWFFALCAVLFSACAAKAPMEHMTITVISRVYAEVEPEKVQALHLAVESCEGLTEIGEIDPHYTSRLVYDKDKRDYVYKSVHVEDKVYADSKTKKCATEVGRVLAYSPHGDASVYGALVRLSQPWIMRYPLIDFQQGSM